MLKKFFKWLGEDSKPEINTDKNGKGGKEPWVNIIGEQIDPVKGIKIELDWNDAFVTYLKKNGYTGTNDEAIVQHWVAHLYQHLIETMKDGQLNEYE